MNDQASRESKSSCDGGFIGAFTDWYIDPNNKLIQPGVTFFRKNRYGACMD
jgi:hypothetical protein